MLTAIDSKAVAKCLAAFKKPPPPESKPPPARAKRSQAIPDAVSADPVSGSDAPVQAVHALAGFHSGICRPVPGWKRWLDIFCVLLSLPITLPSMAAVVLWIKLVSRGPCLFRQERVGLHGRRFVLYKFRSMRMNADPGRHVAHFEQLVRSDGPMVKLDFLCDPRLIFGGCFLRAAGLDELPQLYNVLRGEMSLVGPRPCLPEELRFFSPAQRVRFEALPGLTGIWQVHGKGSGTFSDMNKMDACYVHQSSPLLDLRIMARTPLALLRQMRQALESVLVSGKTAIERPGESPVPGYSGSRPG